MSVSESPLKPQFLKRLIPQRSRVISRMRDESNIFRFQIAERQRVIDSPFIIEVESRANARTDRVLRRDAHIGIDGHSALKFAAHGESLVRDPRRAEQRRVGPRALCSGINRAVCFSDNVFFQEAHASPKTEARQGDKSYHGVERMDAE